MRKDWSSFVADKLTKLPEIVFTKKELLIWLAKRNNTSLELLKLELKNSKSLVFVEKQEIEYQGKIEERFRCYFVYSNNRGRCYVLKFNHKIKIITVFPLGRTTLRRYKRKFK